MLRVRDKISKIYIRIFATETDFEDAKILIAKFINIYRSDRVNKLNITVKLLLNFLEKFSLNFKDSHRLLIEFSNLESDLEKNLTDAESEVLTLILKSLELAIEHQKSQKIPKAKSPENFIKSLDKFEIELIQNFSKEFERAILEDEFLQKLLKERAEFDKKFNQKW